MGSTQQPTYGGCSPSQIVGNAFVHQYYLILHQNPGMVYHFYQDISKFGRPEPNGCMSFVTTKQAINEKILSLGYTECEAEIKTVDTQDSVDGGVIVLVTGHLTVKDNVKRNFTQSFFLAPQEKGYFVLNDIFRYVEEVKHDDVNGSLSNGFVAIPTPIQEPAAPQEPRASEHPPQLPKEEANVEKLNVPLENGDRAVVEEKTPVTVVVREVQEDLQFVSESNSFPLELEDTPKKSYASIVKVMKESPLPKPIPKAIPERPATENNDVQVPSVPTPVPTTETPALGSNAAENGSAAEGEADGHSIYIKNLPINATPSQLEEEFKTFGPIKSGGIQVRSNKQQGFCFGFVEFETASAVQGAIAASPITIGGRQAYVEGKRASSSRGSNRGRYPPGRGSGNGFRNEGARGRGGNYGNSGRGYGWVDSNNRSEFNNRNGGGGRGVGSGHSNDGVYQRVGHSSGRNSGGGSGARVNRPPNGMAAKTGTEKVPATA